MGWEGVVLGKLKDMRCAVMETRDEHSAVKLYKPTWAAGKDGDSEEL